MEEGRVHIVKEIDSQGDLVQGPQPQRPGELGVQIFLWTSQKDTHTKSSSLNKSSKQTRRNVRTCVRTREDNRPA